MPIKKAYNEWSGKYDTDQNKTRDLDQQVTQMFLEGFQFDQVVELGCGTGKNTAFLSSLAREVHALDFSLGMIAQARKKQAFENVTFEVADLSEAWPAETGKANLVACNLVLEHIENLGFIFDEAARVLAPQGLFYISELHPSRHLEGKVAEYAGKDGVVQIPSITHSVSDFHQEAERVGLALKEFQELRHREDEGALPRLVVFIFEQSASTR